MRAELSSIPAIYLGDECVIPQRRAWDLIASDVELAALGVAVEALVENANALPLDPDVLQVLVSAIEAVQLVVRREEAPP